MPAIPTNKTIQNILESFAKTFARPDPASSWCSYTAGVRIEEDHGVVTSCVLPPDPLTSRQRTVPFDAAVGPPRKIVPSRSIFPPADDYQVGDRDPKAAARDGGPVAAQRRTEPETYIYLEGGAVRLLYPIPCPTLTGMNGVALTNANRLDHGEGFTQQIIANTIWPVYGARWRLRFLVTTEALFSGDLQVPPNPFLT